jgi:hypothetical protein
MTVRELIAELLKHHPDALVLVAKPPALSPPEVVEADGAVIIQ